MSDDDKDCLNGLLADLRALADVAKRAPEPTRAILVTNLFLAIQKVRSLLGETE